MYNGRDCMSTRNLTSEHDIAYSYEDSSNDISAYLHSKIADAAEYKVSVVVSKPEESEDIMISLQII